MHSRRCKVGAGVFQVLNALKGSKLHKSGLFFALAVSNKYRKSLSIASISPVYVGLKLSIRTGSALQWLHQVMSHESCLGTGFVTFKPG